MKMSYYYAAMDECVTAIADAIKSKRESANYYRDSGGYKDPETGKTTRWAMDQADDYDKLADAMERIVHCKFNI